LIIIRLKRDTMAEVNSNGVTGVEILTILFIGLKLTGYINWSWWWVLSPLWISFSAVVIIIFIAALLDSLSN